MFEASTIDRAIKTHGWRYDISQEGFYDGDRRLSYRQVLALVLGMTMNDLANYVTDKHDAQKRAS